MAGVVELSPRLFVGVSVGGGGGGAKGAPTTTRFVMERVDKAEDRLNFWHSFVRKEKQAQTEYIQLHAQGRIPKRPGFLHWSDRENKLDSGLYSFEHAINYYSTDNELWIAFVTPQAVQTIEDLAGVEHVEMAVPVMTDAAAPMSTHMGIQRSFAFMVRAYYNPEGVQLHGGLAVPLHSFGAKVISARDPTKLYMITAPVPVMRELMVKALPAATYVGDNRDAAARLLRTHPPPPTALQIEIDALQVEQQQLQQEIDQLWQESRSSDDNNTAKEALQLQLVTLDAQMDSVDRKIGLANRDRDKERRDTIERVAATMPLTSPIWITKLAPPPNAPKYSAYYRTQIYDKRRREIVFERDDVTGKVLARGEVYSPPNETKRFAWFQHRDLGLAYLPGGTIQFLTVDLDALANVITLAAPPEAVQQQQQQLGRSLSYGQQHRHFLAWPKQPQQRRRVSRGVPTR